MNQVLLYSIQPRHALNILNGLKTIEVRKRDLPQWAKDKLAKGEKVVGYMYVTKGGKRLAKFPKGYVLDFIKLHGAKVKLGIELNGLVVAKFEVSGTTRYVDCSDCTNTENGYECQNDFMYLLSVDPVLRKATCLTADEIEEYGNGANLYAHHFTNVQAIEPMELWEFISDKLVVSVCGNEPKCWNDTAKYFARKNQHLTKAPQSFQTVWVKGE